MKDYHDTEVKSSEETYDPYKKADMIEAEKHRKAHLVRRIGKALRDPACEKCRCCGFPIYAEQYSLNCNIIELSDLGSGFPLYFLYSRIVIVILLAGLCVTGIPCLIGNLLKDNSGDWTGDKDSWIVKMSIGNYGKIPQIYPFWQNVLHVSFMFFVILLYHVSRRYFQAKNKEFDIMAVTARDYTVHVYGLGDNVNEEEVKTFFEKQGRFDGKPAKVTKVVFAYKIKEYIDNLRKLEELAEKLKNIEELEKQGKNIEPGCCKKNASKEAIKLDIGSLTTALEKFENELPAGVGRELLAGQAFVSFDTQADTRAVEIKFGHGLVYHFWEKVFKTFCCCFEKSSEKFKGKTISASLANEPSDIYWENLEVTLSGRLARSLKTWLFTFFLLCLTFGMVYGMKVLSKRQKTSYSEDDSWKVRALSIWPSVTIIIINFVLSRLIRYTTSFERPHSVTAYNISVAVKLTLAMFFNTAVIALIVNFNWKDDWFTPGGLVIDITYILISNTVVSPLIYIFSPTLCIHKLKMKKVEKAEYVSQHDANLMFENPSVDMAQRFANISKTVLLTFCYAPVVPIAFIFGLLAVLFEYGIFKWLLLRRHAWPNNLSGDLPMAMFNVIPWSILLYAVNNYVYTVYLNGEHDGLSFYWMLAVIGYNFLPVEWVFGLCSKKGLSIWEEACTEKYEDVALTFVDDYDKLNPITAGEGQKRFAELMLKKQVVDKTQFSEITSAFKLDKIDIFKNMKRYARGRQNLDGIEKKKFEMEIGKDAKSEVPKKKKNVNIELHKIVANKITPVIKQFSRNEQENRLVNQNKGNGESYITDIKNINQNPTFYNDQYHNNSVLPYNNYIPNQNMQMNPQYYYNYIPNYHHYNYNYYYSYRYR